MVDLTVAILCLFAPIIIVGLVIAIFEDRHQQPRSWVEALRRRR